MKHYLSRLFILFSLFMLPLHVYASTTNQLQDYLNNTLQAAGIPDACRQYLNSLATEQLENTNEVNYKQDLRSLKSNLSIFFHSLAEKNTYAFNAVNKQYFLSEQHENPWELILSKDGLAFFKANHVFDNLTVDDIKEVFAKACTLWPFCKG
jgi:hypothetical protein